MQPNYPPIYQQARNFFIKKKKRPIHLYCFWRSNAVNGHGIAEVPPQEKMQVDLLTLIKSDDGYQIGHSIPSDTCRSYFFTQIQSTKLKTSQSGKTLRFQLEGLYKRILIAEICVTDIDQVMMLCTILLSLVKLPMN